MTDLDLFVGAKKQHFFGPRRWVCARDGKRTVETCSDSLDHRPVSFPLLRQG